MNETKQKIFDTEFSKNYTKECFDYWTDDAGEMKSPGYTGDDEYGNGCFGPADERCPICG